MRAVILSIGDELILGQTTDTNSAFLSRELAAIGCAVDSHATVGDNQLSIEAAITAAAPRCDVMLITGGLGPTRDDLTREALARVLSQPLEINAEWIARLEDFFRRLGRPMPDENRVQAMIPRGSEMIPNSAGTAPGVDAKLVIGSHSCRIFAMPGVPKEMQIMFRNSIAAQLSSAGASGVILSRTLHTFGVGESSIGHRLGDLMDRGRNPSVGTTVANGVVSVRINAHFADTNRARQELDQTVDQCRQILGDLIYGSDEQTLPSVVADLFMAGAGNGRNVATAESCTGGLLAKMLTDIPGSSRYFQRGWITYSDQAKIDLLGVDDQVLKKDGAVSESVVRLMARGARERSAADYALAISGIAGPDGGTVAKPIGLVCIALADAEKSLARTFRFPGDRAMVRDRSAKMALSLLRFHMLKKDPPF